jgi:hypothetical protein
MGVRSTLYFLAGLADAQRRDGGGFPLALLRWALLGTDPEGCPGTPPASMATAA